MPWHRTLNNSKQRTGCTATTQFKTYNGVYVGCRVAVYMKIAHTHTPKILYNVHSLNEVASQTGSLAKPNHSNMNCLRLYICFWLWVQSKREYYCDGIRRCGVYVLLDVCVHRICMQQQQEKCQFQRYGTPQQQKEMDYFEE